MCRFQVLIILSMFLPPGLACEKPLVAPRNVEVRPLGGGQVRVDWHASEGATSYSIQRRRPDEETDFTTIAAGITDTSYTDDTGTETSGVLFEYRVQAHAPD